VSKQYGVKVSLKGIAPEEELDDSPAHAFGVRKARAAIDLLLEQLRYAGVISYGEHSSYATDGAFVVWSPSATNNAWWQKGNIDRMASFGIKAEPVTINR